MAQGRTGPQPKAEKPNDGESSQEPPPILILVRQQVLACFINQNGVNLTEPDPRSAIINNRKSNRQLIFIKLFNCILTLV